MSYHKDDCMYFVLLSLSKCLRPYHIFCSLVDTGNRSESMKLILNSELYPEFYPEHLQLPPSIGSSQHLVATKSLVRPVLVTSLSYWNCLCLTDSREMKAYDIYLAFQLIHLSNVTGVVTFSFCQKHQNRKMTLVANKDVNCRHLTAFCVVFRLWNNQNII